MSGFHVVPNPDTAARPRQFKQAKKVIETLWTNLKTP